MWICSVSHVDASHGLGAGGLSAEIRYISVVCKACLILSHLSCPNLSKDTATACTHSCLRQRARSIKVHCRSHMGVKPTCWAQEIELKVTQLWQWQEIVASCTCTVFDASKQMHPAADQCENAFLASATSK